MTKMMNVETGTTVAKGTKVRIVNSAPNLISTVGLVGVVVGNMPNMLMIATAEGAKAALKGWGTRKNPGVLQIEVLAEAN